jgi:hypothetical protein
MWTLLIENSKAVRAIYGDQVPSLQDISFHEINFINGVDMVCNLRFDVKELPYKLPLKWTQKGVDTVQIHLQLVAAEIMFFEYSGSRLQGNLEVMSEDGDKKVEFTIFNRKVFTLKSKWIYVSAIIGYAKE